MTVRGRFAILVAALAALATPAFARGQAPRVINVATRGAAQSEHITLGLDKAALVQLDADARDVLVSNPAVVDAVVRSPRRIFLLAQKTGQTNAFFFDAAGHQILTIDIRVERDVTDLAAMIHNDLPTSNIHVAALNDNIVLTGTVENAGDSSRAQDLAGRFAGDQTKVANLLKIDTNEQVMLKVRIAEVQRSIAKQFGINLTGAVTAAGIPMIASTANPYGLVGQALSASSGAQIGSVCAGAFLPQTVASIASTVINNTSNNPNLLQPGVANGTSATSTTSTSCGSPNNLMGALNALEQVGLVHTLAEPNLTAVSGETAKFLAGGEFPVPAGRDTSGNVSIEFKQFGVGLSFTPVVMSPNRISLQISTEVSELTNTGAFTLASGSTTNPTTGQTTATSALTIPALNVRRAQTTVEVPSGGSFAIAGLLQHTTKQTLDQFPGLGDMPVLGALFRSRDFQNDQTELVVLATAYLVHPGSEKDYALPTDGFNPAADPETLLLGRLNNTSKPGPVAANTAAAANPGFIVQ
jgi:pilus assembly protein CpaC